MEKKKLAYIAGKLNADAVGYLKNVSAMLDCAEKVRKLGYAVFVPCNDLISGIKFGDYSYHDYADNNLEFVRVCDVVFVCPNSEHSIGTQVEIEYAKEHGVEVRYL